MFDTTAPTSTKSKNQEFLDDTRKGLRQEPKSISSKYFYDKKGDELFQQIMNLQEYYLTRSEYEIFEKQKEEILKLFSADGKPFNLVEFGAGDGYKTKVLLEYFIEQGADFEYVPIDISQNALDGLESSLKEELPTLRFQGLQGDYFEVLDRLSHSSDRRNVILFLGSNMGNFTDTQVSEFLFNIRSDINEGDLFFMGVDLKKDPEKILSAYSDVSGVTARFNMNLLERMNRELGANFDLSNFQHHASYDPITGECKSALLSTENQNVKIDDEIFTFEHWEPIHTEISRKYSLKQIHLLAKRAGFEVESDLLDSKKYFVDSVWKAV